MTKVWVVQTDRYDHEPDLGWVFRATEYKVFKDHQKAIVYCRAHQGASEEYTTYDPYEAEFVE